MSICRMPGSYGGPARWPSANTACALGGRRALAGYGPASVNAARMSLLVVWNVNTDYEHIVGGGSQSHIDNA